MVGELRVVEPPATASLLRRAYALLATTRLAKLISRRVSWKLDPVLLRISGGRLSTTLIFRAAVLETVGARSGHPRRNAVIYFHDGDRVTVVASNAGAAHHPSWFHNLRAEAEVWLGGIPMRAVIVDDEQDRARLAEMGDRVFPAFATYRRQAVEAGRAVPVVQLTRR